LVAVTRRAFSRAGIAGILGGAVLALLLTIWLAAADSVRAQIRERALDELLPLVLPAGTEDGAGTITIVDIDRESLARIGPWPWPRSLLARLVAKIAGAGPKVVGIDILMDEPDRLSPAALARALGAATGRPDIESLAKTLPDADAALSDAVGQAPTVLGFALDPDGLGTPPAPTPILLRGSVSLPDIWAARGVIGPIPALAAISGGFGTLALAADHDGEIRRAPLLVFAGGAARPGLAVEMARLAQDAGSLILGPGPVLEIGAITVPLGRDAELRLIPPPAGWWMSHRVSAASVMSDPGVAASLSGKIVLIGGSAPELGGLRATPASPVTPSVLIQATAVEMILGGRLPFRPGWLGLAEAAATFLFGAMGVALAARLRPLRAAGVMAACCVAWPVAAAAAAHATRVIADPAGPPLIAAAAFSAALLARLVRDEWRARLLRARFEQHLAPEVVRRIAADPEALRLRGEFREITAFFTDIEDLTAMTERAEPADLVALLDAYFDMAARVITAHGGMIEKVVGDAVHAIFNAPFDLDDHPRRAVACALMLLAESETVRASALGRKLRMGRTRIGIETGMAIVGDVGGARKLDYTAHGNVMNTAQRLEASNKDFRTSICVGPGAAARLDPAGLRRIGAITPRGRSEPMDVFTPACPH
jgi:adenylate cyclase